MFLRGFVYAFIPIFVAMDIGGLIPMYLTLTKNLADDEKRKVALQALGTALFISIVFVAVGRWIFQLMGISIPDFEIAGGVLLLVLAIVEMLHLGKEVQPGSHVGAVPLGTPLIVGPAVLTSLIILIPIYGYRPTLCALCANLALVWIAFRLSRRVVLWVGEDGLKATSQVISLFLAAIAVSMIRRGFQSLR